MKNKRLTFVFGIVVFVLLVPLVAMQFTQEVNWSPMDFLLGFVLLTSIGLSIVYLPHFIKNKTGARFLILAVVLIVTLLWIEMAVGIFGSPLAGD